MLAMKTPLHTAAKNGGFTLIELMVTMMIGAALMTVGVPSVRTFQRNAELTSASNNLIAAVNVARGEAMKRGTNAMVIPRGEWSKGWVVFIDQDRDGKYSAATDITIFEQSLAAGSSLAVSGSTDYLLFDGSGYAKTMAGGFGATTLTIKRTDVSDFEQMRRIKVAQTGRVRGCKPASASDPDCSDADD
jgi:type IV fimbrial biogenesis protein FimT